MTVLSIVQDAADELGIPRPTTVISNTDPSVMQLLALANRSGKSLCHRFPWQECILEFTHTTLAAESQGTVESIMPGFNWHLYHTIWNRTLRTIVDGPLFPPEWQFLKASSVTGPYSEFRIRGKTLRMIPSPTAGQTMAGEYVSRYWCETSGGTDQEEWVADTDVGILPEDLLTIDLVWRWKRAKGLDYAEEKMEAEIVINNAMARNGSNRVMNLEGMSIHDDYPTGIFVPSGTWSLT